MRLPRLLPVSRRTIDLHRGDLLRIAACVLRGQVTEGPAVAAFEQAFADFVDRGQGHGREAVAAGSGRLGLELVLRAWGLPPGSEVVLPAYEDLSVPRTVRKLGLVPVCADIDPATGNVSTETVAARLGPRTRAVVVAHLFGQPAPVAALQQLCADRGLRLIEDCCHAVGTTVSGRHVGTFGDAAFFSFHATKPFSTLGGCVVLAADPALARALRAALATLPPPPTAQLRRSVQSAVLLRAATHPATFGLGLWPLLRLAARLEADPVQLYGKTARKGVRLAQTSVRYTNLQATLGLAHLARYDDRLRVRRANAATLEAALGAAPRPVRNPGHCDYFFVVYSDQADALQAALFAAGIDTGRDLMRDCAAETGDSHRCPAVAQVRRRSLQVPCHEELRPGQVARIGQVLAEALAFRTDSTES